MTIVDQPVAVRDGESIGGKKLTEFLHDHVPGLGKNLEIHQFPGGFSNLTYLISDGTKEVVLRCPPHGTKAESAHDMAREYRVLKALKPVFPYCPEAYAYTEDTSIIDGPFYVMERIGGIILRRDLPKGMDLAPEQARSLCNNLVRVLHQLHSNNL